MNIGKSIANFAFTATGELHGHIHDYQGRYVVLYFYPKDATPGCTIEGQEFKEAYPEFQKLNTEIFGISRDSLKSHEAFKTKQNFPFELISDPEEQLCQLFDVIKIRSMYGKQVRGIERSTFVLSPQSILIQEWRKVNVKGHVAAVLNAVTSVQ